jgi:NAD(P)-dependent dehydrogenase (short-subunit alcohol dehydrogenase family)
MKFLIITGASKGIGRQTAALFMDNGWQVINLSRHSADVDRITNFTVDLAQPNALAKVQADLVAQLHAAEQISVVHNAAYYNKDSIADIDATVLRSALEVNIIAPLELNQLLIPFMPKGSSIIYIGSTLAEKAVAGNASYVISKHASVGMMRATCQDLAQLQIHSCCICPGFTATEMLMQHLQAKPELLQSVASRVGANRLIEPKEIASLIYYAANNPVLNGAVLHANLGQIES